MPTHAYGMPAWSVLTFPTHRQMFSFQAIQTQVIETEDESTRRAGKPACFISRSCCLSDNILTILLTLPPVI